ncbi:MAG: hypothetical protein Q7J67_03680 [bacterium]|nr:hypothetical protein [bacterium]
MDQSKVLGKNQAVGNVFKCQGGIIHVNVHGVSLHFDDLSFLNFARMVQDASSKLMDDGLKNLLKDE